MLHYDPSQPRALNAAAVAARMREALPTASDAEVAEAARALARSQAFATREAALFWASAVLTNWRLMDADRPF